VVVRSKRRIRRMTGMYPPAQVPNSVRVMTRKALMLRRKRRKRSFTRRRSTGTVPESITCMNRVVVVNLPLFIQCPYSKTDSGSANDGDTKKDKDSEPDGDNDNKGNGASLVV